MIPPLRDQLQAKDKLETLVTEHPELRGYLNEVDWKVEEEFRNWLECQ